ncbi:hypothetical protein CHRY9390_02059 [Chryseobacterium aquaeductus]|uniref:Type II toxin-antitoxin system RelE/ParE family toxin n=1 Tax=Chryseobacterium aquaeductus TaxID=2675056 RepID=A0A9N8QSD9_9FLAO|nr:hypothetical protein [Chryseobacterium aquaeductus]CAA7331360.1 hypothetical protein CHRY9390_02059 [Chryseobacterium potabilaquae]CAD7809737.1 hypothetical protein CHRY9390_02059 [Chryseobacterium aquaeductus]
MQVEFSKIARQTLHENIEFLNKIWTNREIVIFLEDVKAVANNLEDGKYEQFQKSVRNTRSVLIGKKHVRMFFRKEETKIIILLFFDMRQNSQKIFDLLK